MQIRTEFRAVTVLLALIFAGAAATLPTTGCGVSAWAQTRREAALIGTWRVAEISLPQKTAPSPPPATGSPVNDSAYQFGAAMGQAAEDMASAGISLANGFTSTFHLELRNDHTFTLQMIVPQRGRWTYSDKILTLQFDDRINPAPAKATEALRFELREGNDELRLISQDGNVPSLRKAVNGAG